MKLINFRGFVVAFGFDMVNRVENNRMISWCDPETKSWEPTSANLAGWTVLPNAYATPEFVRECEQEIVAYQPGQCLVMTFIGGPTVFKFNIMRPD